MSAKDWFASDRDAILDIEVFGEEHSIDGRRTMIVVDRDALQERQKKEFDGIYVADMLYYVRTEDMTRRAKVDGAQTVDGVLYIIVDIRGDDGITEVLLKRNGA